MSLKAKLEAVIYAAEEPVTLAQLAALFADEALAWKARQQAAAAHPEPETGGGPAPLDSESAAGDCSPRKGDGIAAEEESVDRPQTTAESGVEPTAAAASLSPRESGPSGGKEVEDAPAVPEDTAADAGSEARRQARQRDREVRAILRALVDELAASTASDERGVEIREIAGGYRVATKPECHDAVRLFVRSLKPALKLSLPALETLAVIAYKQPVTAPEVNEIRGVDSSGVFGSLLARKLISTAGRKPVIGRPILYKTTREFLLRFGLKDLSELPSMEEFEKMAAIELDEPETAAGDGLGREPRPAGRLEFDPAAGEEPDEAPAEVPLAEAILPEPSANEPPTEGAPESAAEPASAETASSLSEAAEIENFPHDETT
ncbi:MAG: SMC-Scp complex subunit ScpB [Terracidiphilus sp.]